MSSETKVDDCYYSTNDEGFYNGYNDVYQVKFDGETLWKVHAKLKFGEVKLFHDDFRKIRRFLGGGIETSPCP